MTSEKFHELFGGLPRPETFITQTIWIWRPRFRFYVGIVLRAHSLPTVNWPEELVMGGGH